jgi:DNA-binding transcriptional LysR family regulator
MDRLRRIEMLVRVADAQSFAKAARELDVTASAVSHAISKLEKDLRITVFYRTTRQLRLTEDGKELYRRGREILDKLTEAEVAMSRPLARVSGTLRIGIHPTVSRHIIMPRLPEFMRRHPDLKLECRAVTQVKEMHAAGYDVLLRVGEPPESGLIARKLAQIHFGVYASPEYLNVFGEPKSPDDLMRHRCLIFKPEWSMKPLDEWTFERHGERNTVKVPAALTSDDREALITIALAGGGIFRSGMFSPAAIAMGQLKSVLSEWSCVDGPSAYALYRRTPRLAPKIASFLEFIREAFELFDPEELTLRHEKWTR